MLVRCTASLYSVREQGKDRVGLRVDITMGAKAPAVLWRCTASLHRAGSRKESTLSATAPAVKVRWSIAWERACRLANGKCMGAARGEPQHLIEATGCW